ncbi:uracil-DNA glycosylase [Candidatus Falkowbacteria bacterium]|nr:uracil-DNA glycosylase [Candidatus Falkowbacteria bacterium]
MFDKQTQLDSVHLSLIHITDNELKCLRMENKYLPVFGEGDINARIMIVGEAPGKNEAECGKPFCGKSGKILDDVLSQAGLDRSNIYITNVVKDRPPQNRDPRPDEIELYAPLLDRQIEIIQPKIVITLGRISMAYILKRYCGLDEAPTITSAHGQEFNACTHDGITFTVVPMFHPAATIYNKESRKSLYTDMKKVVSLLS